MDNEIKNEQYQQYKLFKQNNTIFCHNFETYLKIHSENHRLNIVEILKSNDGKLNLNYSEQDYSFYQYLDDVIIKYYDKFRFDFQLTKFFQFYSELNTEFEFSLKDLKKISSKNHILLLSILFNSNILSYRDINEYCEGQNYLLYMSSLLRKKHKEALNGWLVLMDLLRLPNINSELKNKLFHLNKEDLSNTIYNISDIYNNSFRKTEILLTILDFNKKEDYVSKNFSYYIMLIDTITKDLNNHKNYDLQEELLEIVHNIYPLSFVIQDKNCRDYLEFLLQKYEKKYDSSHHLLLKFSEAKSNYEKGLLDNIIESNIPANKKNRI